MPDGGWRMEAWGFILAGRPHDLSVRQEGERLQDLG